MHLFESDTIKATYDLGRELIVKVGPLPGGLCHSPNVRWVFSNFDHLKSPVGDGIFPAMFQQGSDDLLLLLCELFKASLAFGYIPFRPGGSAECGLHS